MVIWMSRVDTSYYRITWEDGKFITAYLEGNREVQIWTTNTPRDLKSAIKWITNSKLERDILQVNVDGNLGK